jgi:hypothetical protein
LILLQLLKKSGWKEGTGLGAQEQVRVSMLASSRVMISLFPFPPNFDFDRI